MSAPDPRGCDHFDAFVCGPCRLAKARATSHAVTVEAEIVDTDAGMDIAIGFEGCDTAVWIKNAGMPGAKVGDAVKVSVALLGKGRDDGNG